MATQHRDHFLSAMSNVANSVTVVTTDGTGGKHGATVSSFCSVSADPPTVLVCLNQSSNTCAAVEENGVFCVNVLPEDEHKLANVFAGQTGDDVIDKFTDAKWSTSGNGSPVLPGVTAFLCTVTGKVEASSHIIFIGEVSEMQEGHHPPLIYLNRKFCKTSPLSD